METIGQDLRYAVRTLLRTRGFTLAAVATLGLGIGAATMIFSLANGVLLRPFPFPQAERLALVAEDDLERNISDVQTSWPTFLDWQAQANAFASLAAYDDRELAVRLDLDGSAERIIGAHVSATLFEVLEVRPTVGRAFRADDDVPGAPSVALISHSIGQDRFGGATAALGRTIAIDGALHTVVGVMPPGFGFPAVAELWVPIGPTAPTQRGARQIDVIGRLGEGVTIQAASAELATVSDQLASEYAENRNYRARATALRDATTAQLRPVLMILLGAVGFVLLIACTNVANLMLARAAGRGREMALRRAIGATGSRIVRQLLTESLVLGLAGGVFGLLLSIWWIELLLRMIPAGLPYWLRLGVDARVLAFTTVIAAGTALLFGLAPALQALRAQHSALKDGGRSGGGRRGGRVRSIFVVVQIAASLVLLVGGLLMVRSFLAMRSVDPGFATTGIMKLSLSLPDVSYPEREDVARFQDGLLERLRARADISSVAIVDQFPISGGNRTGSFSIAGRIADEAPIAHRHVVTPGYFDAMGVPLLRGRAFESADQPGAGDVAIISQYLADRFFDSQDPMGQAVRFGSDGSYYTIVGVAGNVNQRDVNQPRMEPSIYRPLAQERVRSFSLVIRPRGDVGDVALAVQTEVNQLDVNIPVYDVRTVNEVLRAAVYDARLYTTLFAAFGAGALLLACIGLYGVVSYTVAQRTREIGVRMAVGATSGDVVRLFVREGIQLTGIGVAGGLLLALAAARVMAALLFGVTAHDRLTFISVPLLLSGVALLAAWLPSRRAARIQPLDALRAD